ncbi:MAG: CHAT domain-containing protein [Ignavibacteriales bacterium]|nr:CHAT domain-containing protein [Ignavibacteriales bacterium]
MINRLPTYLLVISLLGMNSCSDRSEDEPLEKAALLSREAGEELGKLNYKNAERLLAESIELYSAANNSAKLAEQYASLASVQSLAGKLPEALQSLSTLRSFYRQVADRNAELSTLLEIARLNVRLHNTDQAIRALEEAYLSGQLYQLKKPYAVSALQLGSIYASLRKHTKAIQYLSVASAQFYQLADTVNTIESIAASVSSLLQRGKRTAALQYFAQCENLLLSNVSTVDKEYAYALCGFAFMQAREWDLAKRSFEKPLSIDTYIPSSSAYLLHLGLGEVMYRNYSFDDAQRSFVTAYKSAKDHLPPLVQAYLLIRIADCEVKKNVTQNNQERFIRATQLYEHAQTLCSKAGYGLGEAVILHRFGVLKEISGDEYTALTYFRRAFDKFLTADMNVVPVNQFVNFGDLMESGERSSLEHSFSAPLISLLLRARNYTDAAEYTERTRAFSLQQMINTYDLEFKDPTKQKLYSDVRAAQRRLIESQRALFYFVKNSDNDHTVRLQQGLMKSKNDLTHALSLLSQSYPELNFLHASKKISEVTRSYLPSPVTILRYYFSGNEAWLFIIRRNEEITAVKISSFGLELKKKMARFVALVSNAETVDFERKQLANELYTFLIQPAERFGSQRFLIVSPDGLEKFPFHVLTKNGRPLIESTEVSYLPSLYFLHERKALPRFIINVVAAGFSPDARWGLEFELRDIRSFYKNTQVFVKQSATLEKLESATGELLHIASLFDSTPDGEQSIILSDGGSSVMGTNVPISKFTALTPFPFVYLADINAKTNSITKDHSVMWLMNGTQSLVVNELPITPRLSRAFNEEIYSTYSSTFSPYTAYRQAMIQLSKQKEFSDGMSFAAYFYYGL